MLRQLMLLLLLLPRLLLLRLPLVHDIPQTIVLVGVEILDGLAASRLLCAGTVVAASADFGFGQRGGAVGDSLLVVVFVVGQGR